MDTPLHSVDFTPSGRRVLCPEDTLLLTAARQAGLEVVTTCGGKGTCGKCRVRAHGVLSAPSTAENTHLRPAKNPPDTKTP